MRGKRVALLMVALSALLSPISRAAEDAPVQAPPGLTLTVEVIRGKVALPRGFDDVVLNVVLANHSKLPIMVDRRLEDAISIEHVKLRGALLEPETSDDLLSMAPENQLETPIGPLQPGESLRLDLKGVGVAITYGSLRTHTDYTARKPGRYEVVFNYGFTHHTCDKCFRGPLLTAPITIVVTAPSKR